MTSGYNFHKIKDITAKVRERMGILPEDTSVNSRDVGRMMMNIDNNFHEKNMSRRMATGREYYVSKGNIGYYLRRNGMRCNICDGHLRIDFSRPSFDTLICQRCKGDFWSREHYIQELPKQKKKTPLLV